MRDSASSLRSCTHEVSAGALLVRAAPQQTGAAPRGMALMCNSASTVALQADGRMKRLANDRPKGACGASIGLNQLRRPGVL